jgi:hypothetical protein
MLLLFLIINIIYCIVFYWKIITLWYNSDVVVFMNSGLDNLKFIFKYKWRKFFHMYYKIIEHKHDFNEIENFQNKCNNYIIDATACENEKKLLYIYKEFHRDFMQFLTDYLCKDISLTWSENSNIVVKYYDNCHAITLQRLMWFVNNQKNTTENVEWLTLYILTWTNRTKFIKKIWWPITNSMFFAVKHQKNFRSYTPHYNPIQMFIDSTHNAKKPQKIIFWTIAQILKYELQIDSFLTQRLFIFNTILTLTYAKRIIRIQIGATKSLFFNDHNAIYNYSFELTDTIIQFMQKHYTRYLYTLLDCKWSIDVSTTIQSDYKSDKTTVIKNTSLNRLSTIFFANLQHNDIFANFTYPVHLTILKRPFLTSTKWFIKPTNSFTQNSMINFGVFDYETCNINGKVEPYMLSYIIDNYIKSNIILGYSVNILDITIKFLNDCFHSNVLKPTIKIPTNSKYIKNIKHDVKKLKMFAHNFSHFDINFIVYGLCWLKKIKNASIRVIQNSLHIILIDIFIDEQYFLHINKNKIKFLIKKHLVLTDSMHFIPMSLNEAILSFCPIFMLKTILSFDIMKININWLTTKQKLSLIQYCQYDCYSLYHVLQNFQAICLNQFKSSALKYMTLISYSYMLFKRNINITEISAPDPQAYLFFKYSYKGGRVEIFKKYAESNINNYGLGYVDFVSLYPAICLNHTFPGGYYTKVIGNTCYNSSCYGIYLCKVILENALMLPFLGVKIEKKIVYPFGQWYGIYTSIEIEKALDLGYKIEIISGYFFEKKITPFNSYFEYLYNWKEKTVSTGQSKIAKLLMNGLTGRLGRTKLNQTQLNMSDFEILDYSYGFSIESSPQVAAFITAYARIWLYDSLIYNKISPLYCDTDSIIFEVFDQSYTVREWNCKNLNKKIHKNSVGKLINIANFNIKYFKTLGPRFYILESADGFFDWIAKKNWFTADRSLWNQKFDIYFLNIPDPSIFKVPNVFELETFRLEEINISSKVDILAQLIPPIKILIANEHVDWEQFWKTGVLHFR